MTEGRNFAERLLLARRRKGLTQRALAAMLGIAPSDIHRMERGIVLDPHASRIVALAEVLDVTTDYLLRGIESEDMESNLEAAVA